MGDFNVFHHMPWASTYSIYFFVIGISAALYFMSTLSWFSETFQPIRKSAFYMSFLLLVVGGLLLIADLSQPSRFFNVLNPAYLNFTSPLAWGALNLMSFGLVSVLYFLTLHGESRIGKLFGIVGSLLALGLPVYTGFDLTVHQNRPVWNTQIMPVLFVALSLVTGAAVASFFAKGEELLLSQLRSIMLWSAGAVAVMLVSLLGTTAYGGVGQELTFMYLTTGTLGVVFVGIGIVLGLVLPMALLLAPSGRNQTGVMSAALLLLVGGMALRYSILIGGQIVQTYF
ncbi:MAG: polysulfide reductase NrfD [Alphaproteobacteria bacterium]